MPGPLRGLRFANDEVFSIIDEDWKSGSKMMWHRWKPQCGVVV